jgi:endonuclease/exonuclease/phosphatase family metal-dependent hydrolase
MSPIQQAKQLKRPLKHFFLFCIFSLSFTTANAATEWRVATFNVLDDRSLKKREQGISQMLSRLDADIIALQEVSARFCSTLDKATWTNHYRLTWYNDRCHMGGLLLLVKGDITDIQLLNLPSSLNRKALVVSAIIKGKDVQIANVHLESGMRDGDIRAKQLQTTLAAMTPNKPAIVLGDFNFKEETEAKPLSLPKWQDAWQVLHPNQSGSTFDVDNNPLADKTAFWFEPSRRLDRIYLSAPFEVKMVERWGISPVLSDHYGVLAVFQVL